MTWHNGAGSHAGIRKSNARHRQFRVIRCTHHRVSIRHAFLTPERWQATPGKPWRSNNGNCGPYRGPLHIWIENINSRHRRLRQSLTARRNSSPKQLRPRPGGFAKPSKPARNFCKQPIQWIRKECIDTDQHYFVRTTNLANQRQLPLALRLRGFMLGPWDAWGTPTVPGHHPHAPTAWQPFGIPNCRREDDITSTLMGANWTEAKVLAPSSGPYHQVHAREMWLVSSQGNTFSHSFTFFQSIKNSWNSGHNRSKNWNLAEEHYWGTNNRGHRSCPNTNGHARKPRKYHWRRWETGAIP